MPGESRSQHVNPWGLRIVDSYCVDAASAGQIPATTMAVVETHLSRTLSSSTLLFVTIPVPPIYCLSFWTARGCVRQGCTLLEDEEQVRMASLIGWRPTMLAYRMPTLPLPLSSVLRSPASQDR
ncbi:hypothetical protein PM082_018199 [Marasmius tenuissimus]|nr:hypothetical protein PM082_018199 [Marasmius tenuissimus]